MTQTQSSQLLSAAPEQTQAAHDQQRLLEWLAEHDVECPLCKYNLRNLQTPRCPECGNGLTLGVSLVEPFLAAWIALVVALLPPAGVGALFSCVMLNQVFQFGWRQISPAGAPRGVLFLLGYAIIAMPLSLLIVWKRRRFMQWQRGTQKLLATLAWAADVVALISLVYEIRSRLHIPTHILSGWCAANYLRCDARQRLFAMIAATACDIDGISILFGQNAYWTYHHTFGHNLFFAVAASAALAAFSPRKMFSFVLYLALFHVHLLLDYFGSGPGWDIHYLWPLREPTFTNRLAWPFDSWQNRSFFLLLLIWTLWIARRQKRTPLELIAPRLDRKVVRWLGGASPTPITPPARSPSR